MKKNLLILFCIITCINKIHSQTNWELLNPKPTANTGKDIEFATTNIGYIITSNELLETIDAGSTWLKKQNISSGNDLSLYNATGYIVGNYGYVLKSIDSGASWSQISTGFNSSFNTVNIIDDNTIILSTSNSIVKTEDGGTTWESLSIPNSAVNKTSFTSSLVGHAVCNNGIILKTVDGGQNWYITRDNSNITPSDYFTVYFVNENIGFSTQEHSDMFKTTDGGETWIEVTDINDAIYSIYFLNENIGYATGDHGVIFKTIDSGNTWTWAGFQNGRYGNTSMYGIYFQDNNIGYATGARGRIIKTIDGGSTWTQHSTTYNDVNQIEFINQNIAYVLVGNQVFKTTDGGNTFVLLGTPVEGGYTYEISFINENIGYASAGGNLGSSFGARKVYKTTDGGLNWNPTNNGNSLTSNNLKYIHFIDENIGFAGGGVIKTIDGGDTWSYLNSVIGFGQVQFLNSQIGYGRRVGYSNGRIYKTIDGGTTWNVSIEVEEDINDFYFLDENNGYFVGDNALMHKTTDGGTTWQELSIPYEYYELVKFYSKNVGYIADEDGKVYRTMNGGESWGYLTTQYGINSIELINDKIFTAGSNGKIYRSDVEYDAAILHANSAQNITNSSVNLTGNATSNEGVISNIEFFVSGGNNMTVSPNSINADESLNVSTDLTNLNPNTTYYFSLRGTHNSTNYSSQLLSFTTLPDYEITTNYTYNYTSNSAAISGNIVSNENDITNIEFQYGTSADALNNIVNGAPFLVTGNTNENIIADLNNLIPETQYFYRIKATHEGVDIYGEILSFTTYPEYSINLYNPNINGNDVTLSANLTSYSQDITDIVFEYGTIDYENNVATSPSQLNANNSAYINATISNLDANSVYYYRLKALHNGETIFSEERVFNLSGYIIMVSGTIDEPETNTLELKGLINSYGSYLTNIQFEYGITDTFGSSIMGTPNFAYGYSTNLIKATINNILPNQTYYYRLVATNNGNTIYSGTYQFTTGTLSISDFSINELISVYPNPANEFVNIQLKSSEQINSIILYNVLGKLIYKENKLNTSETIKIDVSNFGKGIYFLKVNFTNNKTISKKFILN